MVTQEQIAQLNTILNAFYVSDEEMQILEATLRELLQEREELLQRGVASEEQAREIADLREQSLRAHTRLIQMRTAYRSLAETCYETVNAFVTDGVESLADIPLARMNPIWMSPVLSVEAAEALDRLRDALRERNLFDGRTVIPVEALVEYLLTIPDAPHAEPREEDEALREQVATLEDQAENLVEQEAEAAELVRSLSERLTAIRDELVSVATTNPPDIVELARECAGELQQRRADLSTLRLNILRNFRQVIAPDAVEEPLEHLTTANMLDALLSHVGSLHFAAEGNLDGLISQNTTMRRELARAQDTLNVHAEHNRRVADAIDVLYQNAPEDMATHGRSAPDNIRSFATYHARLENAITAFYLDNIEELTHSLPAIDMFDDIEDRYTALEDERNDYAHERARLMQALELGETTTIEEALDAIRQWNEDFDHCQEDAELLHDGLERIYDYCMPYQMPEDVNRAMDEAIDNFQDTLSEVGRLEVRLGERDNDIDELRREVEAEGERADIAEQHVAEMEIISEGYQERICTLEETIAAMQQTIDNLADQVAAHPDRAA
jgi:hypothetical protein